MPDEALYDLKLKQKKWNKKLAERLEAPVLEEKKDEKPKPGAKKEDKKEPPKKEVKKDKKQLEAEEEEAWWQAAEAERKAEEERRLLEEREASFNPNQELWRFGGKLLQFNMDQQVAKSQHYNWTLPIFFKDVEKFSKEDMKTMHVEVRTTTVQRALVPN